MRLFLALELPHDLRLALIRYAATARLALPDRAVRWVAEPHLHLTLLFLGEQPPARVPEVLAAMGRAGARCPPLELQLTGSGRFRTAAWVGVDGDTDALAALVGGLQAELGHPDEERPYHPHVTIGRFRDPRRSRRLALPAVGELGRFRAAEAVLFHSTQTADGVQYTALGRAPLTG